MFEIKNDLDAASEDALLRQCESLLSMSRNPIANAANLASLLFHSLDEVNWLGFYFLQDGQLIVGPFQGKPACVEIPLGKGVCGTAAANGQTQRVADVHQFEGHIACDSESKSELVVPLIRGGEVFGVLDIDSPVNNRFAEADEAFFARIAAMYVESCD